MISSVWAKITQTSKEYVNEWVPHLQHPQQPQTVRHKRPTLSSPHHSGHYGENENESPRSTTATTATTTTATTTAITNAKKNINMSAIRQSMDGTQHEEDAPLLLQDPNSAYRHHNQLAMLPSPSTLLSHFYFSPKSMTSILSIGTRGCLSEFDSSATTAAAVERMKKKLNDLNHIAASTSPTTQRICPDPRRTLIQKCLAMMLPYSPADINQLIPDVLEARQHSADLVLRRSVYVFIKRVVENVLETSGAENLSHLKQLALTAFLDDGHHPDPFIRAIAFKHMAVFPSGDHQMIMSCLTAATTCLQDPEEEAFVKCGALSFYFRLYKAVKNLTSRDFLLQYLIDVVTQESDQEFVETCLCCLSELLAMQEFSFVLPRECMVNLLARAPVLPDICLAQVLEIIFFFAGYVPHDNHEYLDIMNFLESRLPSKRLPLTMIACRIYALFAESLPSFRDHIWIRIRDVLLNALEASTDTPSEWMILNHIHFISMTRKMLFSFARSGFCFCAGSDANVHSVKIKILQEMAEAENARHILMMLREYAMYGDAESSLEAIAAIGCILAGMPDIRDQNTALQMLLQMYDVESVELHASVTIAACDALSRIGAPDPSLLATFAEKAQYVRNIFHSKALGKRSVFQLQISLCRLATHCPSLFDTFGIPIVDFFACVLATCVEEHPHVPPVAEVTKVLLALLPAVTLWRLDHPIAGGERSKDDELAAMVFTLCLPPFENGTASSWPASFSHPLVRQRALFCCTLLALDQTEARAVLRCRSYLNPPGLTWPNGYQARFLVKPSAHLPREDERNQPNVPVTDHGVVAPTHAFADVTGHLLGEQFGKLHLASSMLAAAGIALSDTFQLTPHEFQQYWKTISTRQTFEKTFTFTESHGLLPSSDPQLKFTPEVEGRIHLMASGVIQASAHSHSTTWKRYLYACDSNTGLLYLVEVLLTMPCPDDVSTDEGYRFTVDEHGSDCIDDTSAVLVTGVVKCGHVEGGKSFDTNDVGRCLDGFVRAVLLDAMTVSFES